MRANNNLHHLLSISLILLSLSALPVGLANRLHEDQMAMHQKFTPPQWKKSVLFSTDSQFPVKNWWESYGDANLNNAIEAALKNNPDLASIQTRIEQSRAMSKITRADLFPTISIGAQYLYQQYARNQFAFPLPGRTFQSLSTPIQVSYEADIWGKNILKYKAAKRQIDAATFAYDNARIQLAAAVATAYFNVAKLNQTLTLQEKIQTEAERQLFHTQQLFGSDLASAILLSDTRQQYIQATAETEAMRINQSIAQNQLIALTGQSPSQVQSIAVTPLPDIQLPEKITTGLPQELLTHRPDIAQIEANMKTADLNISVARREFLPTIKITGQSGFAAVGLANVFKWKNISSFLQPALNLPIFNGGSIRQNLKLRKAQYADLLGQYQSAIINAYTEAENSLATVDGNQKIYDYLLEQQTQSQENAKRQRLLFDSGITSEPIWLTSDIQQLEVSKLVSQEKAQVLIDTVGLIKALGGGFDATK